MRKPQAGKCGRCGRAVVINTVEIHNGWQHYGYDVEVPTRWGHLYDNGRLVRVLCIEHAEAR